MTYIRYLLISLTFSFVCSGKFCLDSTKRYFRYSGFSEWVGENTIQDTPSICQEPSSVLL